MTPLLLLLGLATVVAGRDSIYSQEVGGRLAMVQAVPPPGATKYEPANDVYPAIQPQGSRGRAYQHHPSRHHIPTKDHSYAKPYSIDGSYLNSWAQPADGSRFSRIGTGGARGGVPTYEVVDEQTTIVVAEPSRTAQSRLYYQPRQSAYEYRPQPQSNLQPPQKPQPQPRPQPAAHTEPLAFIIRALPSAGWTPEPTRIVNQPPRTSQVEVSGKASGSGSLFSNDGGVNWLFTRRAVASTKPQQPRRSAPTPSTKATTEAMSWGGQQRTMGGMGLAYTCEGRDCEICIGYRCFGGFFSAVAPSSSCPMSVCSPGCFEMRKGRDGCAICRCQGFGSREPCESRADCGSGAQKCVLGVCRYAAVSKTLPLFCAKNGECGDGEECIMSGCYKVVRPQPRPTQQALSRGGGARLVPATAAPLTTPPPPPSPQPLYIVLQPTQSPVRSRTPANPSRQPAPRGQPRQQQQMGWCWSNQQCGGGRCVQGRCQQGAAPRAVPCTFTHQCSSGLYCRNARCTPGGPAHSQKACNMPGVSGGCGRDEVCIDMSCLSISKRV